MRILAIDPGPVESAYVLYDTDNRRVIAWEKVPNGRILTWLDHGGAEQIDEMVIEMIASYGMPVGKDVFETCTWIGRFEECWRHNETLALWRDPKPPPRRILRREVKLHLCGQSRAKDGNVRQALVDRIGPKGTKAEPGPTYGLAGDGWAALGVAVTAADHPTMDYR